ncbi:ABC transporter permease [Eubacteriales bacterium OttesenSCG-928-N13]|nr:ABC transporter permease [Eubacteriales bacterium OttesenSCG-928-N13]
MKAELKALAAIKPKKRMNGEYLLSLVISILAALLVGAGIMLISGHNPIAGYQAMLNGALGNTRAIGDTLAKSATLCLTGLAMAVAAKAGIFNVGGEGQLYLGAIAAALVGGYVTGLPMVLGIALSMLAAMVAGGLYALLPAWLKVKLKVNEVITTIMLNSAAIYFCSFLANGPLKTAEKGIATGTVKIDANYVFPRLIKLSSLTSSIFIAAGVAFVIWYLMKRTTGGYEMKLTGENDRFARYTGIKTDNLALIAMVISGAICGLVGMFEVFGLHKRFLDTVSSEFYFDGMLVAMIMRYDPIGIVLMSLFFGILKIGSMGMEKVGIPSETILIVQSIIIFFMAAESGIMRGIKDRRMRKRAQKAILAVEKEAAQ